VVVHTWIENKEASQARPSVAGALSGQAPWSARLAWILRSQEAANSGWQGRRKDVASGWQVAGWQGGL